jgi:signal transduction histidine kinase
MNTQDRESQIPNYGYVPHDVLHGVASLSSPSEDLPCPAEHTGVQAPPLQFMGSTNDAQLCQQVTQIILSGSNFDQTLAQVAAVLGAGFQVDSCFIAMKDEQAALQSAYWSLGHHSVFSNNAAVLLEQPTVQLLLSGSTHTIVLDTQANSTYPGLASIEAQAFLGIAIQNQQHIDGVIVLMRSQPHIWRDSEIEGVQSISNQIALASAQVQLQQTQQKQSKYRAVVNQLTLAIRNSVGLHQILKQAVSGIAEALQVDRGLILRLKYWDSPFKEHLLEQPPKAKATVVCEWFPNQTFAETESAHQTTNDVAGSDLETESASWFNHSFWVAECCLCQQLLTDSSNMIVLNSKQDLASDNHDRVAAVFDLDAMPALLLMPLESQNTTLGFLALQHCQSRIWQPEELELVELVSAQISTAIIQTETLRQVQALVDKRTVQLRQSLELQAKLYEKTRQQIDQLRQLNRLKDEFIDTISHELRTPLTSMTLAIRMLRQTGISAQKGVKYLDILEEQCAQEISLINDLLALQELESRQVAIQLEDVDFTALAKSFAQSFQHRWESKGLNLKLEIPEQPITLKTDVTSLKSILNELLTNAGKYSDPRSVVYFRVTRQVEATIEQVVVAISNTGQGIAPEELPYIFEKFRRGQGATQNAIQGTGLGLALVKSLVQHLNGTIAATSCPFNSQQTFETCFTLTLPLQFDGLKP